MRENRDSPNLLFVFADQMRGMDMACAGNSILQTPAMDRMASEGVRLTQCYATSPVCTPNRATLLSGTFPTTNGVICNDLQLPLGIPTIGTVLQSAGYATGYIGKWHLDGIPRTKFTPPGPRRHGFDFWAAYNCTHDYFHARYYRDTPHLFEPEGYEPVVQTDLALEFLANRPLDKPFCLLLSWGPPHDPYHQVPEAYRARYDPDTLTLRRNVQPDVANPLAIGLECRRASADYYAAISALDDQLARIVEWLVSTGVDHNTVLIFSSDHGDMLWSHGWLKKQTPYEESVNVPFIIRWPDGIVPGTTSSVLTSTVDVLPSLLGLMGVPIPAGIEGVNLAEEWLSSDAKGPNSVYMANYFVSDEAIQQEMPEWRAVHTQQFTYAERVGRIPWLLFDNRSDQFQQQNLIGSPEHRLLEAELADELSRWLEQTRDPFLPEEQMAEHLGVAKAWRQRQISVV